MVLPKATLTDTLIEGGLTPDAAQRTAEMIALGYDEVAKQGEVERRFTEVDRRLDEQDRLVERRLDEQDRLNDANFRRLEEASDGKFKAVDANFKTSDAKIEALNTRITDIRAELLGRIQGLKDDMDAQFAAAKDSVDKQFAAVHQRINDLDKNINRLYWVMGIIAAANFALFGYIISRLP